jgi:sulfite reductase beta subunit-like hemoprotein
LFPDLPQGLLKKIELDLLLADLAFSAAIRRCARACSSNEVCRAAFAGCFSAAGFST